MSKWRIRITTKAQRDFKKLDPVVRKRIETAIYKLETDRMPQQFKPLVGRAISQFRLRVGDWRVLYDLYGEDEVVLILRIGHRRDIYR